MYRGQRIHGSRPPGMQQPVTWQHHGISPESPARRAARLHFLSWNSGGLSSERYQQLALWLRTAGQHIGVVAIQEARWSQDLSFHMDGWLALTSPCLDRVSGILLLVNLRLPSPSYTVHSRAGGATSAPAPRRRALHGCSCWLSASLCQLKGSPGC